ncbi:DNA-binding protein RFX2-like [Paramacrobiotus metropolitanus]|uniref:DNA-binding protein RFX2-like n=1 Tax=Paramacrobiotus metropolitanus TaxID=2943436 RepID=UPI0024460C79|nr:DNA-binding protein RFX2-like [Paramacrobiotus metropolitanus]
MQMSQEFDTQEDGDFQMEPDSEEEDDSSEKQAKDPDYDFDDQESGGGFTDDDEEIDDDSTMQSTSDIAEAALNKDQVWDASGESSQQPTTPAIPSSSRHKHRNSSGGYSIGVVTELIPWLKRNFRLSRNANAIMPRSELYAKYERFCEQNNLTVVNSACLGKVLRRSFPGVDTRRLGRRGESKYHYIGLEVNPDGENTDQTELNTPTESYTKRQVAVERCKPRRNLPHMPKKRSSLFRILAALDDNDRIAVVIAQLRETIHAIGAQHTSFLPDVLQGDEKWTHVLPLPELQAEEMSMGFKNEDVTNFVASFRIHLGMVAYCIVSGAFLSVPDLFHNFWISRTTSLQVTECVSGFDTTVVNALYGWELLQHFVRDCYLGTYKKIEEQFATRFELITGGAFTGIIGEFAQKFPGWIRSAVGDLDSDMLHILHTSAQSLSFRLKKAIELHVAFAKVYCMQNDPAKIEYMRQIFQQVLPAWKQHIEVGFTALQQEEMHDAVIVTTNLLSQPCNLMEWRLWITDTFQKKLASVETTSVELESNAILENKIQAVRDIVLMWTIISKRLIAIARTDVKPIDKLTRIEPFFWLMEFFQKFVKAAAEDLIASIQNTPIISQLYQVLSENANSNESAKPHDVHLSTLTNFCVENLEQINPNNQDFFSACADIKSYILRDADKICLNEKVDEFIDKNTANDQSILEQLLR